MSYQYSVYIIKCNDGSFYTGITICLERRLFEHQMGSIKSCYTYKRRPLELKYCEHFDDVNQAIAWEKRIKGWRREKKIALIKGEWGKLSLLSRTSKSATQLDKKKS